jgi:SnoaL-like domain
MFQKILFLFVLAFPFVGKSQFIDKLNTIVNQWHQAASKADLVEYTKPMSDKFVFLGTAPGERWKKDAFISFSKPYFDKGKAWDFKPSNRIWEFNVDSTIAWFDEELDTWMKGCRGAGIMIKEKGSWKIAYYNLTVLIENEKIEPFILLRESAK